MKTNEIAAEIAHAIETEVIGFSKIDRIKNRAVAEAIIAAQTSRKASDDMRSGHWTDYEDALLEQERAYRAVECQHAMAFTRLVTMVEFEIVDLAAISAAMREAHEGT